MEGLDGFDFGTIAAVLARLLELLNNGAVWASIVLFVSVGVEELPILKQIWKFVPSELKQGAMLLLYIGASYAAHSLACGGADFGLGVPCYEAEGFTLLIEIAVPGVAYYLGSQIAFPTVKSRLAELKTNDKGD